MKQFATLALLFSIITTSGQSTFKVNKPKPQATIAMVTPKRTLRSILDTLWEKQPLHTLELGTAWQKSFFGEVGLMHTGDVNGETEATDGVLYGYKLAYVFTPFLKDKIQGPEISAEINIFLITLRTSMIYYISNINNTTYTDLRFTPEVGLTLFGIPTFCFGWNIPLLNDRISSLSAHRWSINLNLVWEVNL